MVRIVEGSRWGWVGRGEGAVGEIGDHGGGRRRGGWGSGRGSWVGR